MVVAFPPAVRARLDRIEADEGVPAIETVHAAVEIWTLLTPDERRVVGFTAMHMVVGRLRNGG